MNAGIFLLGFGGMRYFREQSITFAKYGFTVAVKLFVIQLLMSMSVSFTNDFKNIEPTWGNVAVIMGASLVMVMLVRSIPSVFTSHHGAQMEAVRLAPWALLPLPVLLVVLLVARSVRHQYR